MLQRAETAIGFVEIRILVALLRVHTFRPPEEVLRERAHLPYDL
jgi:hypothetical protein